MGAFSNGGDFAYDGETTVTGEEKKGTDLYGTMTIQAYDSYGDAYSSKGSYSETLTWINGWFKETKDGVNMYELDNDHKGLLTYTSDVSSGSATLTVDTTKLDDVSDWENTYGNSFTIIAGCGGDGWSAENLGKTIEVTFTVTNVSNKTSTYELTLDGPDGTYDLTRAYADGKWSFANLEEGSTFDGTVTGTVGLTVKKGDYDVGTTSFENLSSVELSLTDGTDTYTCSASYDGSNWTCTNGSDVANGEAGYMSLETGSDGKTTLSIVLSEERVYLKLNK